MLKLISQGLCAKAKQLPIPYLHLTFFPVGFEKCYVNPNYGETGSWGHSGKQQAKS